MSGQKPIRMAQTFTSDPRLAVREFFADVAQPDMSLVIFFCSSQYELEVIAEEMRSVFTGINVVGCTTARQIGPGGYSKQGLSGASFSSLEFSTVSGRLGDLQNFSLTQGNTFVQSLLQALESQVPDVGPHNSFAFLLIDGLSVREEPVAYTLQHALGRIQLCGGSASDDLKFAKTHVYHDGHFHEDSAVLVLAATPLPFKVFITQHFIPTEQRFVVTRADPPRRIVHEINGLPAAEEFARLAGIAVDELDPRHFAAMPVVVLIDGMHFVRSIQKVNGDGSLTFFCAIEAGLVLRVAHGIDLINNLKQTFDRIHVEIGQPQCVLISDCILRYLEISQDGSRDQVEALLLDNRGVGFCSYGEQFRGVHVNQTLTGIAIGVSREP
jgi:hypothetical protein